jgi:PAT family beta-lactamase induction signal transducer AmpG
MIKKNKWAWAWVPTLYFAQGLPYALVVTVSVIMYKKLGFSNSDLGLYTSLLYIPWVIKPLWSPFVDLKSTKRNWFLGMQLLASVALLAIGLTLPTNIFFVTSLACFWMVAFASATNDIATDGYYMIGLTEEKQSFFVGLRSVFYKLANVTGQGLLVVLAGTLEQHYGDNTKAWSITMICAGTLMLLMTLTNFFSTPKFETSGTITLEKPKGFLKVFISFFKKPGMGIAITFILFFRLGESQLVKMASPFLLDPTSVGGLGYSTSEVGTIYGTIGVVFLTIGGILGGILISRNGLKKWMLPMLISLNAPNALYAILAITGTTSIVAVTGTVIVEQFGYGFGIAGFMVYLIYIAEGNSKTSHYALATGFMALGMMLPGLISGFMQEWLGYDGFFIWVVLAALPAFILLRYISYPPNFGKAKDKDE